MPRVFSTQDLGLVLIEEALKAIVDCQATSLNRSLFIDVVLDNFQLMASNQSIMQVMNNER